jgi:phosphate uptake regulator
MEAWNTMSNVKSEGRDVRKLQITGGSTYIISLPKQWVTQMALTKGSTVTLVRQNDGSIALIPENLKQVKKSTETTIEVRAKENPDLIMRKIVSAYLVGYTIIYLKAQKDRLDFTLRNAVKDFTRKKLVGTEIIADSPSEIVMKVLLSYPDLSVESALRRMCIITSSMHKDAMTALKDLDAEMAREVIYMDDEVDRFSLYIIRQLKATVGNPNTLKEIGLATARDCLGYRLITKSVERTADHAVQIAENVVSLKKPLEPVLFEQIESMSASAIAIFNTTIETLFTQNFQQANLNVQEAKETAMRRTELMEAILERTDMEDTSHLSLIVESITRTAEYASDIAEVVLNLNIEQNLTNALSR